MVLHGFDISKYTSMKLGKKYQQQGRMWDVGVYRMLCVCKTHLHVSGEGFRVLGFRVYGHLHVSGEGSLILV
jgi:hypothetical protein